MSIASQTPIREIVAFPSTGFHQLASRTYASNSIFWHQHLRRSFVSISDSLVYSLLCLRKHTLIARYTHLIIVFLLSGILHTVTEVAAHYDPDDGTTISFRDSQCIRFFLTQALGIMIEDGVQKAVRTVWPDRTRIETLERVIGWMWVLGFLGWSTPAIMYPAASLNTGTGKDRLLPISIFQGIKHARG